MSRRLRRWLVLSGASMAVALGAAVAYYRHAPETAEGRDRFDAPPASPPPPATVMQPAHRTPPAVPPAEDAPPSGNGAPGEPPAGGASGARASDTPSAEGAREGASRSPPRPGTALPDFFAQSLETGRPPEALQEGTPQALQARMESEPRDEEWASRVEWQLENYLALQPHNETFGSPGIQCRTSVCRVISTTKKRTVAANPGADWHEMMAGLQYELVANEFSRSAETIVYNHSEPDRVGYVTYFERKSEETP